MFRELQNLVITYKIFFKKIREGVYFRISIKDVAKKYILMVGPLRWWIEPRKRKS